MIIPAKYALPLLPSAELIVKADGVTAIPQIVSPSYVARPTFGTGLNKVTTVTNTNGDWQLDITDLLTQTTSSLTGSITFEITAKSPAFAVSINPTEIQC